MVSEQQKLFDKMKPFDIFNFVIRLANRNTIIESFLPDTRIQRAVYLQSDHRPSWTEALFFGIYSNFI